MQFPPEQTVVVKGVWKSRVTMLEQAIRSKCGAVAVNSVADKDPLCQKNYLIYANYTSPGNAKKGKDKLEHWLDDNWSFPNRPGCTENSLLN
jgi:hypothetical protein